VAQAMTAVLNRYKELLRGWTAASDGCNSPARNLRAEHAQRVLQGVEELRGDALDLSPISTSGQAETPATIG